MINILHTIEDFHSGFILSVFKHLVYINKM